VNKTHNNICNLAFLFPRFKTTICGSGVCSMKKKKKKGKEQMVGMGEEKIKWRNDILAKLLSL
jgi:hypothetical protein